MKNRLLLIIPLLLILLSGTTPVLAVEVGGEYKVDYIGVIDREGNITETDVMEILDLEFFLPELADNELKFQLEINNPLQGLWGEETSYFTKKLYLKHHFEDFNITVGRQPVSWSFGSLLNPVDYTLGAVAMNEETGGKYTDALELLIPFNWNSNLTLVTSLPDGFGDPERVKWGIRGRTGVKDYDLTFNFVREPAVSIEYPGYGLVEEPAVNRAGLTFKGDLGSAGLYGALGYYRQEDTDMDGYSYLLGMDYSYLYDYFKKINIQGEYLGIKGKNLADILGTSYAALINIPDSSSINLFVGNISYPIDDFSSISLMALIFPENGSSILSPIYQNQLPGDLTLTVRGSLFNNTSTQIPSGQIPTASIDIGLSYPF